ncbi:unnamed protein product, partial [Ixodes pacificus]
AHLKTVGIWQWNCRGFQRKRAVIQQFIRSHPEKPHVILLQETLSDVATLPGYKSHIVYGEGKRGICTLVSKGCTSVTHDLFLDSSKVEHSFVAIIPSGRLKCSIFILHIYSSPKDLKQRFASLFRRAAGKGGGPRSSLPATSTLRTERGVTREQRARETICGKRRLITTSRSSRTRRSRPG